jgi:hypothetical protein
MAALLLHQVTFAPLARNAFFYLLIDSIHHKHHAILYPTQHRLVFLIMTVTNAWHGQGEINAMDYSISIIYICHVVHPSLLFIIGRDCIVRVMEDISPYQKKQEDPCFCVTGFEKRGMD